MSDYPDADPPLDAEAEARVDAMIAKLDLGPTFAADYDHLPWHYAEGETPTATAAATIETWSGTIEEFAPPPGQPRDWHGKWLSKGGGFAPGGAPTGPSARPAMAELAALYNTPAENLHSGQGHYDQERAGMVFHALGYDGAATVVSPADFTAAAANSPHGELWRVVTTPAMADQYRTGPMYVGQGYSGSGTYTMQGTRDEFEQSVVHGSEFGNIPNPGILHMTLAPDAKVMNSSEGGLQQYRDDHQSLGPIASDPGALAAAEGYDAIRVSGPHPAYYLILNRTKAIVSSE